MKLKIPAGKKKLVHVNMHVIRKNRQEGTDDPPITVKTGRKNHRASSVEINGPSRLVYSAHKPLLKCGARLVIQTDAELELEE